MKYVTCSPEVGFKKDKNLELVGVSKKQAFLQQLANFKTISA
jgi:hypothetical protein